MKALQKILVIFYCVSFIGMTVSPSSAIPCCCKTKGYSCMGDVLDADQCSPPSDSCCSNKRTQAQSCCGMRHHTNEPACAFTKTTNLNCGHCSCLKHLQLVGISENVKWDRVDRADLSASSILVDSIMLARNQFQRSFEEPVISPPDQTFLLHCSLRI